MKYRPLAFVRLDGNIADEDAMNNVLTCIKKAGYGGLVPVPVLDAARSVQQTTPEPGTDAYWIAYGKLLGKAKKLGLQVVYYDDIDYPSGKYAAKVVEKYPEARAQMLVMREYLCTEGEVTRRTLDTDGVTMSITAYELDTGEIIDLRDEVVGDTLVWDTPDGNWDVLQFVCKPVSDSPFVNFLNYKSSMRFVEMSYKPVCERFSAYLGDILCMTWYDDLQYEAPNRRMWSPDFNEVFQKEYGFDPAPYYPALFFDIRENRDFYVAHLMQCRAKMFADGFFRAVADYTRKFGLLCAGHLSESKAAGISNLFGDAMSLHQYAGAVGVDMIHAYMYGFNGLKLASSAAYNYEKELIPCEMYQNYTRMDPSTLYKEAMNAYARGINLLMPDVMQWSGDRTHNHDISLRNPAYKDVLPQFTDFATRCQAMLQGGTHVCDIAVLYPIESLHAKVYLYDRPESAFQFPPVLPFADYMSNINAIMNFCGRDVTILHPDIFCERCRADNGILYLENDVNPERFQILIVPACIITSIAVMRLIKKFYDCGGKVLITSEMPTQLMDRDKARKEEAEAILFEMFGVRVSERNYVSDHELQQNEHGGMAIFLRSSITDLDGTEYVEANRINQALWRFQTPVDIVFEHLPRIANSGILALNLIAFRKSGANVEGIRSGGVFNYIHKRHDGCDVYYIANTTVKDYHGNILICGSYRVEEWNPHTGKIKNLTESYSYVGGVPYTALEETIPSDSSVFLVCTPTEKTPERLPENTFDDFGALREYYNDCSGKKTTSLKSKLFNW